MESAFAASTRCCIRPEGPAAVNLGKDLRMSIKLRSGGNLEYVHVRNGWVHYWRAY